MKKYYYINAQGTQVGPCSLEEMAQAGINAYTKVWYDGLPQWTIASNVLEFQPFVNAPTTPPPFEEPAPPKPDTYLVWAILTTLLCFMPFGVVAIVYSIKADSYWTTKRWGEAYEAARKSKNWSIASAIALPIFCILYFILLVAGVGFAAVLE